MKAFFVIIGIWLLINVLFVVVMTPPRKPRRAEGSNSAGLSPVQVDQNSHHFADDDRVSIRHTIIAVALGAFFSLTPPLIEAVDQIKRLTKKRRKAAGTRNHDGEDQT
ncbi:MULTISPECIES: hypothetical protein [unclassified Bradyrhizobium]|uniref:hypothetical protein n=1 Tax=unclassified Bradyrhizobium TaxID=2631580 RepID=UPI0020B24FE5|nr:MULTISPECIES: hypothetical protein [unclassified Bradyrhizobium]MCP3397758.1 hypothetical protein [Bradyrhizobium sp. CCGB20]MCP3400200.1 hypothetical protein [Bradyrhizobium sp. CCGB20]MCP3406348.1 hypothetical protein [Bradyrhizobium sp. CCGB01]